MKSYCLGHSTCNQSINILSNTAKYSHKKILIMSGIHGDEIEGFILSSLIMNNFFNLNDTILNNIIFLPIANPDGFCLNQRWNINNVDLNRNWPTKDWSPIVTNPRYPPGPSAGSEIETKTIKEFIQKCNIEFVIELHSYKDSVLLPLFYSNPDSYKTELNLLSSQLRIPIEFEQSNLGYSIAGGFHTWCFENNIHNLTIEIKKGLGQFEIKELFLEPMVQFIKSIY